MNPAEAPPRTDLPYLRRRSLRPAAAPANAARPTAAAPAQPGVAAAPASSTDSLLDLSVEDAPQGTPARLAAPTPSLTRRRARLRLGPPTVLGPTEPSLALTRLQSGVGALVIEAACSPAVGDLALAVALRTHSGGARVVKGPGPLLVPTRRPVVRLQVDRFAEVLIDLRQVRDLDRFLVLAFSVSGGPLLWGGTLVVTTFSGARAELPLDAPAGPGVVPVLSGYVIDGEIVLRCEPWEAHTSLRDACLAMGYDRITWLDPQTPAD